MYSEVITKCKGVSGNEFLEAYLLKEFYEVLRVYLIKDM